MNSELIQQLIDVIKTHPQRYSQKTFGIEGEKPKEWVIEGSCGSPCCIAGHVMILTNHSIPNDWEWCNITDFTWKEHIHMEIEKHATAELGITIDQGNALFRSMWSNEWKKETGPLPLVEIIRSDEPYFRPNHSQAIQVLDRLLNYGFSHFTYDEYYTEKERDNE